MRGPTLIPVLVLLAVIRFRVRIYGFARLFNDVG